MSDQPQAEQQPQIPPAGGVQLQLSDLFVAVQAINIASGRGAFRPEEFAQIGTVYDRIMSFLKANGAIAPVADQDQDSANPEVKEG